VQLLLNALDRMVAGSDMQVAAGSGRRMNMGALRRAGRDLQLVPVEWCST
jgi:hypothetical protein